MRRVSQPFHLLLFCFLPPFSITTNTNLSASVSSDAPEPRPTSSWTNKGVTFSWISTMITNTSDATGSFFLFVFLKNMFLSITNSWGGQKTQTKPNQTQHRSLLRRRNSQSAALLAAGGFQETVFCFYFVVVYLLPESVRDGQEEVVFLQSLHFGMSGLIEGLVAAPRVV